MAFPREMILGARAWWGLGPKRRGKLLCSYTVSLRYCDDVFREEKWPKHVRCHRLETMGALMAGCVNFELKCQQILLCIALIFQIACHCANQMPAKTTLGRI